MSLRAWIQLSLTAGMGPATVFRLVAHMGSAEAATKAKARDLAGVDGIGQARATAIAKALTQSAALVDDQLAAADKHATTILDPEHESYPPMLRLIPDPPVVLYVKGALEPRDLQGLAVVGSRNCSMYGREQAARFGAILAGNGFTVVSGGARGIDSAAHQGAMRHPHGRTIAVLGCSVDVVYPPENTELFDKIAAGRGAVVSEFAFTTEPLRTNFPRRNRIISGMSRGVLVVEADVRSGALQTARYAADDHGRTVYAIPGRVDNPMSAGPHQLLRDGAVLVENITDIVSNLEPLPAEMGAPESLGAAAENADADPTLDLPDDVVPLDDADSPDAAEPTEASPRSRRRRPAEAPAEAAPAAPKVPLTPRQRSVLDALDRDGRNIDQIAESTALEPSVILTELTMLCLKGVARRVAGQTFAATS